MRALPGDWSGVVVIVGGMTFEGPVRLGEHHLATHLARYAPVLFVEPPISPTALRRDPQRAVALQGPSLQLIRPGLARLQPVVLRAKDRVGVATVANALLRRRLRQAVRALDGSVQATVLVSPHRKVFGTVGEHRKVYWVKDDYSSGASLMGLPERRLRKGVARLAAEADVIVAASPVIAERLAAMGHVPVLLPNACDVARFTEVERAPWPDDVHLEPPIAGFVGQLSERIDIELLHAVAERGSSLLLVGPQQRTFAMGRLADLLARPNVQWVGPKGFDELPSYMRAIDVGLVPYRDDAFNRASFPLKTLEYLASGSAVVATDLPAVRWLQTDLIVVAADREGFTASVERALADPGTDGERRRRRAFAATHGWEQRAQDFAGVLGVPTR